MKTAALARAYVMFDRLAFFRLRGSTDLQNLHGYVQRRLNLHGAQNDFEQIVTAGGEEGELLWILLGCEGFPGFYSGEQLFGVSADELKRDLDLLINGASMLERVSLQPFGLLIGGLSFDSADLARQMRLFVRLARAAQKDFSRGAHWFLNIAKARLVIHVVHRTRGAGRGPYHDKELSALIAAMTGGKYSAEAQAKWRDEHRDLINDPQLDPYTTQTNEAREQSTAMLQQNIGNFPQIAKVVEQLVSSYLALIQARH